MDPDREERHADKKARRRFLRNGGGLGSDRIYKAFDDTLHFLPALCVVGFPENCLLLRLRHSGVGIQSRFIHGKCHTKSHGYFGKIHTVFLLFMLPLRNENRFHLSREPLNKSSAAEQRSFSSIRAVSKVGNTYSIPPLLKLSAEEKSLAASSCRFNQSFPGRFSVSKGSALLFFYFSLFRQIHTL